MRQSVDTTLSIRGTIGAFPIAVQASPPKIDALSLRETTTATAPALGWRLLHKSSWPMAAALDMNPADRAGPSSSSTSPHRARPCEGMMLVLLDDDDGFRSALGDLLSEDGHSVQAFRSVWEMPPLEQLPPPAALITEYEVGDSEDGLGFARRFHAVHPDVPIIIVSAYLSEHLVQSVADTPYLSLLRKPVRYEELHELLHASRRTAGK